MKTTGDESETKRRTTFDLLSFFRARVKKGIARHIDASNAVWTLIDNGKLANRIAGLASIVIKKIIIA